jgi:cell division protein FtsB
MGNLVQLGPMNIWDKLTKAVVFLLVVAGVMAVCVWYLPLVRQNERLRREMDRLDVQIAKEEEQNRSLRASVEAGHNDPRTVARSARTYLGYACPGEIVVRFEPPTTTNQFR